MTSHPRDAWFVDGDEVKPALSLIMTVSRASLGALLLREVPDGPFRTVASEGISESELAAFSERMTALPLISQACTEHRSFVIRDAFAGRDDQAAAVRELSQQFRFRGMEVLPLERRGAAILGALLLAFRTPLRRTTRTQRLTALTATLIALALDNARLRADAERRTRLAEQNAHDRLQFLARINHELRTPLQSIGGYIELLRSDAQPPTPRQRQMLDRIEHSERVLLGIIDDVASLGRIEAGRMTYALKGVRVADVVATVEAVVRPLAARQGVEFQPDAAPRDVLVHADPRKLTQILINLVTNAVKFSGAGGRVTLRAQRSGSNVDIIVRDDGPGIPKERLATIFEPYTQLDPRRAADMAGVGLGLAISREFATGMGGRLVVESNPPAERGARFILSLRAHSPQRDSTPRAARMKPQAYVKCDTSSAAPSPSSTT